VKRTKIKTPAPGRNITPYEAFFSGLDVKVKNLAFRSPLPLSLLEDSAKKVLKAEKIKNARVFVLLATDSFITKLNRRYLSQDRPTDVLSFDMNPRGVGTSCLFGEVVVSVDAARRAARALRQPWGEELCRYLIHGLLHLVGYDDRILAERKKMWKRQETLLKKIKKIWFQRFKVPTFQGKTWGVETLEP